MIKSFLKLTSGYCRVDHSMGFAVNKFDLDRHPTYVRPHLVETMFRTEHDGPVTAVTLSGYDKVLHCTETPEQIMAMIAEIEMPGTTCLHENTVTDNHGHSYCKDCDKEL